MARATRRTSVPAHATRPAASHPHSVAILAVDDAVEQAFDQPFAEGAQDATDPDLRHRMISETAYHRYVQRGYADGYDLDDWLQAEAEVDHLLLHPNAAGGGTAAA